MKARFPLSAKIVLWFFANLLLVAVAAGMLIEFEFHLGPEALLGGSAGRRVEGLGKLVGGEIALAPQGQWNDVLERAGNLYGIRLLIVAPDGRELAGEKMTLPNEVMAELYRQHPPGPLRGPPLGPEEAGPPPGDGNDMAPPPPPGAPGGDERAGPPPEGQRPPGNARDRRMIHTANPGRYWLLLPLDGPGREMRGGMGGGPPLTLIAVSESIGLGGLVVDFTPWIVAAGGVVIFSVLFWLPLVGGITRSIREMTGATARVAEGRFDVRVGEKRSDELGLLGASINQMAERLAGFVNGQKRFLGDIAHELCSPLARAQLALGIMERELNAETLEDLREEVQQMSALVNELLSFSKASLAAGRIELRSLALKEEVERAIARENVAGADVRVAIGEELWVKGEAGLLCRAVSNLVRNAVKYAGDAGPVEIEAERVGGEVALTISDHGPGVPEGVVGQIFDPFYRVDVSRARETGGTGLGLAIVKTCVESCGGRVSCHNRAPHGLSVVVTLAAG